MQKRYRVIICLFMYLFCLSALIGCAKNEPNQQLQAEQGVLKLGNWQSEQRVVKLDGQWEFYWQQLLFPLDFTVPQQCEYINLPGSWNKNNPDDSAGDGYATYRLVFTIKDSGRLAFKLPRIFTAYKLWVNNELIASAGTVGVSRSTIVPQYLPQVAGFEPRDGENSIIIQVANFHHRSGGILESLVMGTEDQILAMRNKNIALELLLFGSLLIMGIYHLALFCFRKKYHPPLYFGLFCLLVAVRTILVGERFLIYLLPSFNWEIAHKIQTSAFYLGVLLIVMFFKSLFPADIAPLFLKTARFVILVFTALVLLTPARIFTLVNPVYQFFALVVIIYLMMVLSKKIRQKEQGISFIVVGALVLFITSINDIIFLSIWLNDYSHPFLRAIFRIGNLSSLGQMFFVFTQSLLLAQRFSDALEKEENVTVQLKELNLNLDRLVKKRTAALEKSRLKIEQQKAELEETNHVLYLLSLKDPLTNIWNRRQFDQTLQAEWSRCLRQQRPLSLLIMDLDHFKEYNDCYGHKAGDDCLLQIAQVLKAHFRRADDLVARYGGEEFVVIMPELKKEEAFYMAKLLCQRIENLRLPHKSSPVNQYVTVSIGVAAMIPQRQLEPSALFALADQALYQAKVTRNSAASLTPSQVCNVEQ